MRKMVVLAAVLAACGGTLVACAVDQSPVAPQAGIQLSQHTGGTLTPVPFFVCDGNMPSSASAVIGPDGGTLSFGRNMLAVPAGALAAPTTISASIPVSDTIAVHLQPENLVLSAPATLQLSYAQCLPQPTVPVGIIAVNDQLNMLLGSVSSIVGGQMTVSGPISHLGVYAVALR